jgi:hypothetical protein
MYGAGFADLDNLSSMERQHRSMAFFLVCEYQLLFTSSPDTCPGFDCAILFEDWAFYELYV